MRSVCRQLGRVAGLAGIVAAVATSGRPASAQTITIPQWMKDSVTASNSYLLLWQYWRGSQVTSWNLWTNAGDPLNPNDDLYYVYRTDTNGNITYQCDWGSSIFSAQRPTVCVAGANGTTTGDDTPYANILTLHVEDSTSASGFTDYQYPKDGAALFGPPTVDLPDGQGFFAPYQVPASPSATGPNLIVNQKTQFARDLLRVETTIKNNGGSARRVGARLVISGYIDLFGNTKSIFIPQTRERILYEKDYKGAFVPKEWEEYDDDEGPNPNFIVKGILRGNGATDPSRVVFGNMLDIFPWAIASPQASTPATYDWTVRTSPPFELRLAQKGEIIYWDPISIPAGQTKSFVTFVGMGVASHAMSDAYQLTQATIDTAQQQAQGFVGAVQAPFALPVINGDTDSALNPDGVTRSPLEYTLNAYIQNETSIGIPSTFAYIQLPDGLKFSDNNPTQSSQVSIGTLDAVGQGVDEGTGNWTLQATGIEAGLLPVDVTFGDGFQDSAHTVRLVNVPQGRLYQFGNDWRMITFPFNYNALQNDPTSVFGLPAGSFQIVQYNPVSGQYEQVTQIQPGQSYWVRMLGLGDTFVRLNNAAPIKLGTRDTFSTQVHTGWNQVGNPSPYTVRVADLRFLAPGGTFVSWDQAVSAGYIRPTIYSYNRKTGVYTPLDRTSLIPPGQGVWMYATSERYPVWPAPQGPKLSITP